MNAIALKYSIILFIGQIILFFIVRTAGMTDNTSLIIISALFQLAVLYFGIRAYRLSGKSRVGNYMSGVMMGMYIIMAGALAFTIFLNIYLNIDPGYSNALENNATEGAGDPENLMSPINLSVMVFGAALAVGVVGSYILTRIIDMNIAHVNTNVNSPK